MAELDRTETLTIDGEKWEPWKSSVFRFYLITENGEDGVFKEKEAKKEEEG